MTIATKEKTKQTLLKEFQTKYEAVTKLSDTVEIHHLKAYTDAASSLLKDKEGNIDYKLLKDANIRTSMADKMSDFFIDRAREYLHVNDKLSDLQKEMLLNAYTGITRGQLMSTVHRLEDDFTLDRFKAISSELKKGIHDRLKSSAYAHISDKTEHKKAIIKDLGLEGKLNADLVRIEELEPLMEDYHINGGVIPLKAYQKLPAYKAMLKNMPEHKAELKKHQQN